MDSIEVRRLGNRAAGSAMPMMRCFPDLRCHMYKEQVKMYCRPGDLNKCRQGTPLDLSIQVVGYTYMV
jgi:hypothetical protein